MKGGRRNHIGERGGGGCGDRYGRRRGNFFAKGKGGFWTRIFTSLQILLRFFKENVGNKKYLLENKYNKINSTNCWKSRLVATISEQFWSEVWSRLVSEGGKPESTLVGKKSREQDFAREKCQKRRRREGPWRQSKNPPQILPRQKNYWRNFAGPSSSSSLHIDTSRTREVFLLFLFVFFLSDFLGKVRFFSADLPARSFFPWRTENNSARKSRI